MSRAALLGGASSLPLTLPKPPTWDGQEFGHDPRHGGYNILRPDGIREAITHDRGVVIHDMIGLGLPKERVND